MSALTSLLVRDKIVPVKKIEEAIQRQVISGGEMDSVLLELKAVDENVLAAYAAAVFGLPSASRDEVMSIDAATVALVPLDVAEPQRLIPLGLSEGHLVVASSGPLGVEVAADLSSMLSHPLDVRIVADARIDAALAQHYGVALPKRRQKLVDRLAKRDPGVAPQVDPPDVNVIARETEASTSIRPSYARVSEVPVENVAVNAVPEALRQPSGESFERVSRVSQPARAGAAVAPESAVEPARSISVQMPAPAARRGSLLARHRGPLTARKTVELFELAESRDDILEVFFAFAAQFFDYTALFVVHDESAEGLRSEGSGATTEELESVEVPLKTKGTFGAVHELQAARVGTLALSAVDTELRAKLRREDAQPSVVMPVTIGKRVVLLLYGDRAAEEFGISDLPELYGILPRISDAFQQLILRRKIQGRAEASASQSQPPRASVPAQAQAPVEKARPAPSYPRESAAPAGGTAWERQNQVPAASQRANAAPASPEISPAATMEEALTRASEPPPKAEALTPQKPRRTLDLRGVPRKAPPPPAPVPASPATRPSADPFDFDDEPELTVEPADESEFEGIDDDEAGSPLSRSIGAYSMSQAAVDVVSSVRPPAKGGAPAKPASQRPAPPQPSSPAQRATELSEPPAADWAAARPAAAATSAGRVDPRREGGDAGVVHDVVKLGGALSSDASSPAPAPVRERASAPSFPAGEEPSVIVSMGADVEAVVAELVDSGPDDDSVIQRIVRVGEEALPALIRQFPGPLWFDRHQPHRRRPRGRDVSAIARATVELGDVAAAYLAPLLDHQHADIRYYATLLASEFMRPELVEALGRRIYDTDDDTRNLALELLRNYRRFPAEFNEVLEQARVVARSPRVDGMVRAAALSSLGELRDERSLELLVSMVGHDDRVMATEARRALVTLARQDCGDSKRKWNGWVEKNKHRNRIEWLIDALSHGDEKIRGEAGEELKQLTQEYFGYHPSLPKRERETAQKKYRNWWNSEGRARFAG